MIYPRATLASDRGSKPFLQIGEIKYGRPILDRGIRSITRGSTAAKTRWISLDSTMRSNVTVGPPIDPLVYEVDTFKINYHRRFTDRDPDLAQVRKWNGIRPCARRWASCRRLI